MAKKSKTAKRTSTSKAVKTAPRKRRPKDMTQYDLRGIRSDLDELRDTVDDMELTLNNVFVGATALARRLEDLEKGRGTAKANKVPQDSNLDKDRDPIPENDRSDSIGRSNDDDADLG